jgi:uncharacterized membrane protein
MFESWIFWAIAASLSWSVGQIISKKSLDHLTPLTYNLLTTVLGLVGYLAFAFFLGIRGSGFSLTSFLILTFVTSTYLLYFYVTSMADISLVGTIWACYPITTMLFSVLFLGERVTPLQVFFVLIILFGVALIGLPQKLKGMKFELWFWLAVFCAGLVGFSDFLVKVVIGRVPMGDYYLIYALSGIPGMLLAFLLDKKGRVLPNLSKSLWLFASVGGLLFVLGNIFFFMSFSKGPASLVAPVSSSYQAITVLLAIIFLKEKIRKVQALGVALAVLGIILIGK